MANTTKERIAGVFGAVERDDYALAVGLIEELRKFSHSLDWKRFLFKLIQQVYKKQQPTTSKTKLNQMWPLYVKLSEYVVCDYRNPSSSSSSLPVAVDLETRNALLFYNTNLFKIFMNEKLYDMGVDLLNRIQELTPFLSDKAQCNESTINYIKFIAGQAYNFTVANINKNDAETTSKCIDTFSHAIKFYMKQLYPNMLVILATVQPMDQLLIKSQRFHSFFADLITFALGSITADSTTRQQQPQHVVRVKQVYLFNMLLLVFVQYRMLCLHNKLDEDVTEQFSQIKSAYKTCIRPLRDQISSSTSEFNEDIELFGLATEIYEISSIYGSLLAKKSKSISTTTSNELAKCEKKLLARMSDYMSVLEDQSNSSGARESLIYQSLVYQYLHEYLFNTINLFYLADVISGTGSATTTTTMTTTSKYPTESMLDFLAQTSKLKAAGVKFLHACSSKISQQLQQSTVAAVGIESSSTPTSKKSQQLLVDNLGIYVRSFSQRTMSSIMSSIKLGECIVKNRCQQHKQEQTSFSIPESLKDSLECLLLQGLSFLKLVFSIKKFTDEEVGGKHFSNLEWFSNRISSPLSANINADYLRFQWVTVQVSEERLLCCMQCLKSASALQPMIKSYRQYMDNLLLGLRMCGQYDKVREHLSGAYKLFSRLGIELTECNWLVMNWCKMKRDMCKASTTTNDDKKAVIYSPSKANATFVDQLLQQQQQTCTLDQTTQFRYLFEELKYYAVIRASDNLSTFLDESYQVLEKMRSITASSSCETSNKTTKTKSSEEESCESDSWLIKSRVQLEMIQFALNNKKTPKYQFKESIEDLFEQVKLNLHNHKCASKRKVDMMDDQDVIVIDDAEASKENKSSKKAPASRSMRKRLSSPTTTSTLTTPVPPVLTETNKINKRRKLKVETPQMSSSSRNSSSSCLLSSMIGFIYQVYKFMFDYSRIRDETGRMMKSLTETRIRIKEGGHHDTTTTTNSGEVLEGGDIKQIKTNADRLSLQTTQTVCLIVPDWYKDETRDLQSESNQTRVQDLLKCLRIVYQEIVDTSTSSILFADPTMKKQLYDSIDLYAQVCAFLGFLVNRVDALQIKFKILRLEEDKTSRTEIDSTAALQYGYSLINLCKALLSVSQCVRVEKLLYQFLFKDNNSNENTDDVVASSLDSASLDDITNRVDQNKILAVKEEMRLEFLILLSHYFALTRKFSMSIRMLKERVITSSIVTGKNTISSFEAKYQYKQVVYLLSMSSIKSTDFDELGKIVDHDELPLSTLDDVYNLIYPVVRLDLGNALEPYRIFTHSILKTGSSSSSNNQDLSEDSLYFEVLNAKNFQILTEQMDVLSTMCSYSIEISRYRDATTFIRDALDIAQMHFSTPRCALFLLHQIYADIIGHCFDEAASRMRLAKKFLNSTETTTAVVDLFQLRNLLYMHYLELFREIKISETMNDISSDVVSISEMINEKATIVKSLLAKESQLADYAGDILFDLNILAAEYAVKHRKSYRGAIKASDLLRQARERLPLFSRQACVVGQEKWRMARFYLALNDYDSKKAAEYLRSARGLLEPNPHPVWYRRTLLQLAKIETTSDNSVRASYLLETQSIALRHKAIAVHLKHKRRKNLMDAELSERFVQALSFTPKDLDTFVNQTLPADLCVLSLLLLPPEQHDDHDHDLVLIRLERGESVVLAKFKYDSKYAGVFKHLMQENEKSMKLSDKNLFWSNRNQLNRRLSEFIDEIEEQVFGKKFMKGLLLGGYTDFKMSDLLAPIRLKLSKETFKQHEQLLRSLILGIEFYTKLDIKLIVGGALDDSAKHVINYLESELRSKLVGAKRKHVCLLVDKNLHQIPWESMPVTKSQLITRMPSIHFLHTHLIINSFSIDKEKGYYIVDPGSDLAHTRSLFQQFFEKRKSWEGIIGVAPNESQFRRALTEYELFIYTGHGSGSQYYPSDDVQRLRVQACSILMGCSSGNQYVLGDFEPYGTVLAYILAGCPCIVGNLWDVTDRDIDKLTQQFLDSWIEEESQQDEETTTTTTKSITSSICWHLTNARKACRMTYLNGSAPVVYGLPVNFKSA